MRFELPLIQLDEVSRDHRLVPVEATISMIGTGAPVSKRVGDWTTVQIIGIIDQLERRGDAIMAIGEIWHDLDAYKALMDGELVLSGNFHVGKCETTEKIMIMSSLTLTDALVVERSGWLWVGR